jgi:hypothetical protein
MNISLTEPERVQETIMIEEDGKGMIEEES